MTHKEEFALMIRALALYGMDDLNFTHCSARVEDATSGEILITSRMSVPFWAYRAEHVAETGVRGLGGPAPNPQHRFNHHIHDALERAAVVIHTHTAASIAVAATLRGGEGLPPVSQNALQFGNRFLEVVPYRVLRPKVSQPAEECVEEFGATRMALLIKGHGTLTLGRTIGEAFEIAYNLEKACRIELAMQMNLVTAVVPPRTAAAAAEGWTKGGRLLGQGSWPALRDWLARTEPSPAVRGAW